MDNHFNNRKIVSHNKIMTKTEKQEKADKEIMDRLGLAGDHTYKKTGNFVGKLTTKEKDSDEDLPFEPEEEQTATATPTASAMT